MKRENIPAHVWADLVDEAEYSPEEVLSWSPQEVFEKYCEWHGLLGWHRRLWGVVEHLFRNEVADKYDGTLLDQTARVLAKASFDGKTEVTIPTGVVFMLMELAAESARVRATLGRN